jgi:hypothetical protein
MGWNGRADEPGGVSDHEGHLFWSDIFCGYDEVAFILAVEVVEDYDELAIT